MTTPPYDPNAGQYNPDPTQYGQAPGDYGQAPGGYTQGPGQYGQAPQDYGQAPGGYGQGPGQYGQGPVQYGQGPAQYGQGPQGTGPGFAMPSTPYFQSGRSLAGVARNRGMRQIGIGAAIFAVGLVITIATYASASSSATGGTYFVAYGPMIVGAITVVRGFIALARSRNLN